MFTDNDWRIHPSYKKNTNFQRLEFFGDKLVGFELSKILLKDKKLDEGDLSIILANLACKDTMAKIAKFLIPHVKYTGKLTNSMLASILEAWIGYQYHIRPNYIKSTIYKLWSPYFKQTFQSNAKNIVQEFAQKHNRKVIYGYEYNGKQFHCTIELGRLVFSGYGVSKKEASEKAASRLMRHLEV